MRRKVLLVITGLVLGAAETLLGWRVLAENYLGAFLIFTGLGYCIGGGFFLAFGPAAQPSPTTRASDRALLCLAPGALIILLAVPLEYLFLPAILPRPPVMPWLGLALITLGMAARIWTRVTLKNAYQGNLQVQSGQQIITGGPYRWVRHPGYFAFVLQALGLAVGFSSLSGLLGVALLLVGLRYRTQVEEIMLVQAFGDIYTRYARQTRRLIPWIW